MAQKRIPKKIIQRVAAYADTLKKEKLPIQGVYLFGSFATGKQHKWSDIDVCVISPKFKNSFTALQYLWKIRPDIINPYEPQIEPIGFTPKEFKANSAMVTEIKRTGIKIQ